MAGTIVKFLIAFACWFVAGADAAQMPQFEVDRAWPLVPPKWKLGDASSIAIDAQDNVYMLHRPRTLKPEDAAMAALPVTVFDGAGNYVKSWGGAGSSYEWPEREHGIHVDRNWHVWIGGKGIFVVDRKSFEIVGAIQVPGQLGPGHHIATDSKGNIYLAQTAAGLQKLVLKGVK